MTGQLHPKSIHDLGDLILRQTERRWRMAEAENASARRELAFIREHAAELLSQHEPLTSLGLNRERVRLILDFVLHGDRNRLEREHAELRAWESEAKP